MDYETTRDTGFDTETNHMVAEIAAAAVAADRAGAVPLLPNAENVIVLPAGATLDDITVNGRDLVIQLDDGRVFIIPDGAIYVPQIVIDGVVVPPLNLAALLIGEQPQPAAGDVPSSGGNFAQDAGPIQAAFDRGDLLPYTELAFPEQPDREVIPQLINNTPTTIIITPDNPAGAMAATASVNEKGLPARGALPAGSGEIADGNATNNSDTSETTSGTIDITSLDGIALIALNGTAITQVGQTFAGTSGTLTITSIDLAAGTVGYSYTLASNTSGDNTADNFAVAVTDTDGDTASATLAIRIIDDMPTAHNDTDSISAGGFGPATGNVISGDGTTNAPASADTPGADGASVTRIASNNVPANVDTSFDAAENLIINGQYGVLSIKADGSYSYTRNAGTPGNVSDVFTYTLTDGDTDTSTATLTIAIGDSRPVITDLTPKVNGGDALVDEDDLSDGSDSAKESLTATGTFTITSPDGIASLVIGGHTVITNGSFVAESWETPLGNTISITGYNAATGVVSYSYTLLDNEAHGAADGENLFEDFSVVLTDLDGTAANDTLSINIVDDVPTARDDTDAIAPGGSSAAGNVITGVGTTNAPGSADTLGADGAVLTRIASNNVAANADDTADGSGNFTVTGQYGSLVINQDGSYTYTRTSSAGGNASDVFTYTLRDGDGDTTTATLTISLPNSTPSANTPAVVQLDDDALAGGNAGGTGDDANSANTPGTLTGTGGDGDLDFYFSAAQTGLPDGFSVDPTSTAGVLKILQGATLVLTVTLDNETGGYSVAQNAPIIHAAESDENNTVFNIGFYVQDADGSQSPPANLTINVDDDVPSAADDGLVAVAEDTAVTIAVLSNDTRGADGVNPATGVALGTVLAAKGVAVVNADGTITYTPNAGAEGADSFTYTITDGDGDKSTATVTLNIAADSVPSVTVTDVTVDEAGLPARGSEPAGSNSGTASETAGGGFTIGTGNDTLAKVEVQDKNGVWIDVTAGGTVAGATGTLTVTALAGVYSYSYTLTDNLATHPDTLVDGDSDRGAADPLAGDAFAVRVTDNEGDVSATDTINVTVLDDGPSAAISAANAGVVHDETAGLQGSDVTGPLAVSASNPGEDLDVLGTGPIGYAKGTVALSSAGSVTGADGGTTVISLTLSAPGGVDSGLDTTEGVNIYLFKEGNVVVGRVGATAGTAATGVAAFAVGIESDGTLGLVQYLSLQHPIGGSASPNESISIASNILFATTTVTDGDGDVHAASTSIGQQIGFLDDGPTIIATAASTVLAVLDETATNSTAPQLTTTAAQGDDPNVPGSGWISRVVTSASVVTVTGAFGADGAAASNSLVYALTVISAASGLKVTDGAAINLEQDGNVIVGKVATGAFAGQVAFAIGIDSATGIVTVEQYLSLQHLDITSANEFAALAAGSLGVTVTRTDGDGDFIKTASVDISSQVRFHDDGPTLGVVQSQQADNNPAQAPAVGTLHFVSGSDGPGSTMTITANLAGITSGGHAVVTQQVGNVLTGYADISGNGFTGDDTPVFTLTISPTAGTSGQYVFDLIAPLDGTVVNTLIGGTTSFGSGPAAYQVVSATTVAIDPLAIITGWHTDASFNAAAWYNGTNILPAGVSIAQVNGSTAGWGVDNNNFTTGEFIRWDFGTPIDDFDGPGGYVPPSPALPEISYATFDLIGYSGGDTIQFVVHHTDGTTSNATITGAALGSPVTLTAAAGKFIDWIDTYAPTAGSGKIDITAVGVLSSDHDNTIPFTLQLRDGDGDPTSTASFSVHVKDGLTPFAVAPPVVLDLDGDGTEFVARSAGVTFDYLGDGSPLHTAWAGKDDGILAIDLNGNGRVDSGKEIVFGGNGLTDLQGIAASYDSNHDGLLDARDADFAKFGVWQDANSNGVNDAGEFRTLAEAGIASINLTSDGKAYSAAGGDITVHGETVYTRTDGSTGTAADASFAVSAGETSGASWNGGDVMSGLLALGTGTADAGGTGLQTTGNLPALLEALGDSAASNFIDGLVDNLTEPVSASDTSAQPDTDALASWLHAAVGPDSFANIFIDMNQFTAHAEAMAAATVAA